MQFSAGFACILLLVALHTGCSKKPATRNVTSGETKSTSGQTIRLETQDADLLETCYERNSTIFKLRSGNLQVSSSKITWLNDNIYYLPEKWTAVKLIKANGHIEIMINEKKVASVDIAA